MRLTTLIKVLATLVKIFLFIFASNASAFQEYAVYPSEQAQESPDIDDGLVVWQQLVEGDWDVYAADITELQNPYTFVVAEFADDQINAAVFANTIVWQDYVETDWGIYGVNLASIENVFNIADYEQDQTNPAIFGNTVVWQDNYYGGSGTNAWSSDRKRMPKRRTNRYRTWRSGRCRDRSVGWQRYQIHVDRSSSRRRRRLHLRQRKRQEENTKPDVCNE